METRSEELLDGHGDDALGQPGTTLRTVFLGPKKSLPTPGLRFPFLNNESNK